MHGTGCEGHCHQVRLASGLNWRLLTIKVRENPFTEGHTEYRGSRLLCHHILTKNPSVVLWDLNPRLRAESRRLPRQTGRPPVPLHEVSCLQREEGRDGSYLCTNILQTLMLDIYVITISLKQESLFLLPSTCSVSAVKPRMTK